MAVEQEMSNVDCQCFWMMLANEIVHVKCFLFMTTTPTLLLYEALFFWEGNKVYPALFLNGCVAFFVGGGVWWYLAKPPLPQFTKGDPSCVVHPEEILFLYTRS